MSENPPMGDELSALDDAQLRRIAYGRGEGPDGTSGLSREAAAQELARRTPPPATPAPPAPNTPRPLTAPHPSTDEVDPLVDDDLPRPFWTRARLVGAAVLAASIAVGGAIGVGIDRAADALAPESLAIFDRPATEDEVAIAEEVFATGFVLSADTSDTRYLTTADGVQVFAQRVPADYGSPRSDVGDLICVVAVSGEAQFFTPDCVPLAVFERQGFSGALVELPSSGAYPDTTATRSIVVTWGPRGDASVVTHRSEESP